MTEYKEDWKSKKNKGPHEKYIDSYVRIITHSGRYHLGKLIFADFDENLLLPYLNDTSLNTDTTRCEMVEKGLPNKITSLTIESVTPIKKEYLDELVEFHKQKRKSPEEKKK